MNETAAAGDRGGAGQPTSNGPLHLLIANEASACYELDTIAALVESLAELAGTAEPPEADHGPPLAGAEAGGWPCLQPRLRSEEEDAFE